MQSITISTNSIRLINYATSLQETSSPFWNFSTFEDLSEHIYQSALIFCSNQEVQVTRDTTQDDTSFTINTSINKKPRYNHQFIISSL